jgi:hypothetical protein
MVRFNSGHDGEPKTFSSDYRCQVRLIAHGKHRLLEARVYLIGQEVTVSSVSVPIMIAFLDPIELDEIGYTGARFEVCEGDRVTGDGTVRSIAKTVGPWGSVCAGTRSHGGTSSRPGWDAPWLSRSTHAEPPQIDWSSDYGAEVTQRKVVARLRWLTEEEGGRTTEPTSSRYVTVAEFDPPAANWPHEAWSVVIEPVEAELAQSDDGSRQVAVTLCFLMGAVAPEQALRTGVRFRLLEGKRVVADGEITDDSCQ